MKNISDCQGFQRFSFKYRFRQYLLICIGILWLVTPVSSQEYFQQEVNTKICVTLNDKKHELIGFESVEYINNSPDTLWFLFFHLWPNAYSDNNTSLARELIYREGRGKLFNDPELNGHIDSLDFKEDGRQLRWNTLQGFPDICKINLNHPLNPGDTIILSTPFHVKIPKGVSSRLGHIGESYQISQWYPKPAVYDKSGWHQMPYLDQGEFYSEYGSYDVSITLPANYIICATGNLQNEEEKRFLDILSADTAWKETGDFGFPYFPPSSNTMKTVRYTEHQVHDFAWFADKRFHVLKGNVKLPQSGREVTTWAMFTYQEAQLWKDAISYVNNAILSFSEWIGDYPYDNFTAVQSALNAGAGMEYPGLTVIGLARDPYLLDEVIAHEICHSWFYSAVGSDERRFPYMDESTASTYESRYMEKQYPGKKLWEIAFTNIKLARFFDIDYMPVQRIQEIEWLVPARENSEQPANLPAPAYSYTNYGSMVYNKAALGFTWLRSYMGDSLFDSAMHNYYGSWKEKHPQPEDLKAAFASVSNKDLSWFFDDYLSTTKRLDYKMVRLKDNKLLIRNKGELNSPLLIAGMKGDSIISEKWEEGFAGKKWFNISNGSYSEIRIDPRHKMTELYRLNDNIRTSGILRRSDPPRFRFAYTIEDTERPSLIYFPAFDWNSSDGFMAGVAFNNGTLLPKPVEYFFIPFYTFRDPGLAGYGKISFNKIPYNNVIRMATLSFEGSQFGAPGNQNFQKAKIGLDIFFRSDKMTESVSQKAFGYYITASDHIQIEALTKARMRSFIQLGYTLERKGIIDPFNMSFSYEIGRLFQKASAELNYKYSYSGSNNGLDMRVFAGTMLRNSNTDPLYAFSASGRSGSELYLYQGVYPDRFSRFPETFWSRQMSMAEGGLVTPVNDSLGYSHWIISFSLTSSLPGIFSKVPVKPFATILLNDHSSKTINKPSLFFEAGVKAGVWDFFEVYFPIVVSDNLNPLTGTYKERIRFVFRLDKLNPLR